MDIITKTGEIWSENAIGAVISLIKKSDDSIEAERKLTHWLTEMNCQLMLWLWRVLTLSCIRFTRHRGGVWHAGTLGRFAAAMES